MLLTICRSLGATLMLYPVAVAATLRATRRTSGTVQSACRDKFEQVISVL